MESRRGIRRRELLAGAGVAVASLTGFTAVPASSFPRPLRAARATALADADLMGERTYGPGEWDPDSGLYPEGPRLSTWWLVGSSTAEFAQAHVAAAASALGASAYLDAKAGESDAQISARMGLAPARLSFPGGVVPSGTRINGLACPLAGRALKPYAGRIEGTAVTGVLSWDRARDVPRFERTDGGAQVRVPDEVRFLPTDAPAHRADLTLFLGGGKNSITSPLVTAGDVVTGWEAQHAWLAPRRPAFLRQGFFANAYAPDTGAVREGIDAVNAWGRERLGARFLDVAAWLASEHVWAQTGVRPLPADLAAQRAGRLPPSLADRGGFHLSDPAARAWVHHVVRPRILALGWA